MFSQFVGAEMLVQKHGLTKDDLDAALESHKRAAAATEAGHFKREIVALEIETPNRKEMHVVYEGIRFDATLEGIAGLKLLQEGGAITAASASQICDGASAGIDRFRTGAERSWTDAACSDPPHFGDRQQPGHHVEEPLFAT